MIQCIIKPVGGINSAQILFRQWVIVWNDNFVYLDVEEEKKGSEKCGKIGDSSVKLKTRAV